MTGFAFFLVNGFTPLLLTETAIFDKDIGETMDRKGGAIPFIARAVSTVLSPKCLKMAHNPKMTRECP